MPRHSYFYEGNYRQKEALLDYQYPNTMSVLGFINRLSLPVIKARILDSML